MKELSICKRNLLLKTKKLRRVAIKRKDFPRILAQKNCEAMGRWRARGRGKRSAAPKFIL